MYWFVPTGLVETVFISRLLSKLSWRRILQTYNIARGEFWGLVLLYIGVLPVFMRWLRG